MHVMTGSVWCVNSFPDCPLLQEILINKNESSGSLDLSASGGKAVSESLKDLSKGGNRLRKATR